MSLPQTMRTVHLDEVSKIMGDILWNRDVIYLCFVHG